MKIFLMFSSKENVFKITIPEKIFGTSENFPTNTVYTFDYIMSVCIRHGMGIKR